MDFNTLGLIPPRQQRTYNPYDEGTELWKRQNDLNAAWNSGKKVSKTLTPQEIHNFSGAGKVSQAENGQSVVSGGMNMYGFKRPDTYLVRGENNQLLDPFKEKVGASVNKLKD